MAIVFNRVSYGPFNDISFDLEDGKITGILLSSAGDRRLLGVIISKKMEVPGVVSSYKNYNIGYNYQNPDDMLMGFSVREELTLALKRYGYKKETNDRKCEDIIEKMSLNNDILDKSSFALSSSERKLVSIAVNLITDPKVLILDEPWLYLDDEYKKKLIKLFKKIVKDNDKIIVILSSNVSFVYDACDSFILLAEGKVTSTGSKKKLVQIDDKLWEAGLRVPSIITFIDDAFKRKNVTLEKTYDIKELMKDVYRNVK